MELASDVAERESCQQQLDCYGVLDTPPERDFNDLVELAADICGVPLAAVTLVDWRGRRLFTKATRGFSSDVVRDVALPDDERTSLCCEAVRQPHGAVLQVADVHAHSTFARCAWGSAAGVRFFAGAALHAPSGDAVGALCVMDAAPREPLSAAQAAHLRRLARQVICNLELGRAVAELHASSDALQHAARERARLRDARSAALAELAAERARFVNVVSDEVRVPLGRISAAVAKLTMQEVPPEQTDLEKLAVDCTHLQLSVNGILDDAAGGALSIMPEPADLLDDVLGPSLRLVQHIHTAAAPGGSAAGARVLHTVGPGVPSRVRCDAPRVVSVLAKLLNNSLKHVAAHGAVELAVYADAGSTLRFTVADDGAGMDAGEVATIFQQPDEASATSGERPRALERGLAFCKRLAGAMGGDLRAESAGRGRGAAFVLTLPLTLPPGEPPPELGPVTDAVVFVVGGAAASAARRTRPSSASDGDGCTDDETHSLEPAPAEDTPAALLPGQRSDGTPIRLLVAEDDRVSQLIMTRLLKHIGASALIVSNGGEAVAAWKEAPRGAFDLLLLDTNMPVLDGPGVARALTKLGNTTPMVALTANVGPEAQLRCFDAGMVGYLQKPVKPETLAALRPFAERRAPAPEDEACVRSWMETQAGMLPG